jgi:hypothetical protein
MHQLLSAVLHGRPTAPLHDAESALADDLSDPPARFRTRPERARDARLSVSAQAHQTWVRKRTRRWHAAIAGAVAAGVAVMCEKRARRLVIAQQLFVRGLQGSWNAFSARNNIRVPYGDVLVFSLAYVLVPAPVRGLES